MTTLQFIQKAHEGGWSSSEDRNLPVILDPKAWEAVGKTQGWTIWHGTGRQKWEEKMHDMIDDIIKGKTIEECLEVLE